MIVIMSIAQPSTNTVRAASRQLCHTSLDPRRLPYIGEYGREQPATSWPGSAGRALGGSGAQ